MAKRSGTTVLIGVESATPGTFVTLAGQRDVTLDRTGDFIDASSKDSNDEEGLAGRRSSTISLDAAYIDTDASWARLKTLYETDPPALCKVRKSEDGTDVLEADAVITSLGERHPDNDLSTVSIELRVSGGWTAVP